MVQVSKPKLEQVVGVLDPLHRQVRVYGGPDRSCRQQRHDITANAATAAAFSSLLHGRRASSRQS